MDVVFSSAFFGNLLGSMRRFDVSHCSASVNIAVSTWAQLLQLVNYFRVLFNGTLVR